jgi:hypothetical protein
MNNIEGIIAVCILGVAFLTVLGGFIIKWVTGKPNIVTEDTEKFVDDTIANLDKGETFGEALGSALSLIVPEFLQPIVKKIPTYALSAIKTAQSLTDGGALAATERKALATTLIKTDLKNAGVTVTSDVETLISLIIDDMCLTKPTSLTTAAAPAVTPVAPTASTK